MIKLGLRRAMLLFAIVQALTNLGYLLLYAMGKNYAVMVGAVALDALASGMGNIASVALMMALCDKRFSAFQYALLSMMALLPRYTLGGPAGYIADHGRLGRVLLDQLRACDSRASRWCGSCAGASKRSTHRRTVRMREIDTTRVLCSLAELDETGSRGFAVGEGDWPLRGFLVKTADRRRGLRELLPARGTSAQLPAAQIPDAGSQPDPVRLARRAVRARQRAVHRRVRARVSR